MYQAEWEVKQKQKIKEPATGKITMTQKIQYISAISLNENDNTLSKKLSD